MTRKTLSQRVLFNSTDAGAKMQALFCPFSNFLVSGAACPSTSSDPPLYESGAQPISCGFRHALVYSLHTSRGAQRMRAMPLETGRGKMEMGRDRWIGSFSWQWGWEDTASLICSGRYFLAGPSTEESLDAAGAASRRAAFFIFTPLTRRRMLRAESRTKTAATP